MVLAISACEKGYMTITLVALKSLVLRTLGWRLVEELTCVPRLPFRFAYHQPELSRHPPINRCCGGGGGSPEGEEGPLPRALASQRADHINCATPSMEAADTVAKTQGLKRDAEAVSHGAKGLPVHPILPHSNPSPTPQSKTFLPP